MCLWEEMRGRSRRRGRRRHATLSGGRPSKAPLGRPSVAPPPPRFPLSISVRRLKATRRRELTKPRGSGLREDREGDEPLTATSGAANLVRSPSPFVEEELHRFWTRQSPRINFLPLRKEEKFLRNHLMRRHATWFPTISSSSSLLTFGPNLKRRFFRKTASAYLHLSSPPSTAAL